MNRLSRRGGQNLGRLIKRAERIRAERKARQPANTPSVDPQPSSATGSRQEQAPTHAAHSDPGCSRSPVALVPLDLD
jgi:hypothetical protein